MVIIGQGQMELELSLKQKFFQDGYLVVPKVVSEELINKALHLINSSLGEQGMHPDKLDYYYYRSFCPEIRYNPILLDLVYKSPLISLVESIIGTGKVASIDKAQIALRFPVAPDIAKDQLELEPPHLDGITDPNNDIPLGEMQDFTGLIGVYLSPTPEDMMGNLVVWPGTHMQYEAYFRKYGPDRLLEGTPNIDLPEPVHIHVQPGDIVLRHFLLAHTVAPNVSPNVRYALYYRFNKIGHAEVKMNCLTDIWYEWESLRGFRANA